MAPGLHLPCCFVLLFDIHNMVLLYFFQDWKDEQHLKQHVFAVWAREVVPPPLMSDSDDDWDNDTDACENWDFVHETAHVRMALRQAFEQADVELADLRRCDQISYNDWLNLLTIVNTALQLTSYGGMLGGWREQGDRAHAKKLASDVDYLRLMYEKTKKLYCKFDAFGRETNMAGWEVYPDIYAVVHNRSRCAEYGGDTDESGSDDSEDEEDIEDYAARAQYDLARAQYWLADAQYRLVCKQRQDLSSFCD